LSGSTPQLHPRLPTIGELETGREMLVAGDGRPIRLTVVHYDITRTSKKRRKKRLKAASTGANASPGSGILRSVQKGPKRSRETIVYTEGVDPSVALKACRPVVDLVGIEPKLLREIIKTECGD
jgi:hypothetical protein